VRRALNTKERGVTDMALVECQECGKQISYSAKRCPNCGAKTRASRRTSISNKRNLAVLAVLLVVLAIVYATVMMPSTIKEANNQVKDWLNQNPRIKLLLDDQCKSVDLQPILPPFKFGGYAIFEKGAKVFVTFKTNPFTGNSEWEVSQSEMTDLAAAKFQESAQQF
jgi:predicted RNA-binding Zn-ribbon protein involved in translation (DUF1610 family)